MIMFRIMRNLIRFWLNMHLFVFISTPVNELIFVIDFVTANYWISLSTIHYSICLSRNNHQITARPVLVAHACNKISSAHWWLFAFTLRSLHAYRWSSIINNYLHPSTATCHPSQTTIKPILRPSLFSFQQTLSYSHSFFHSSPPLNNLTPRQLKHVWKTPQLFKTKGQWRSSNRCWEEK
jgi:hypothetical protein